MSHPARHALDASRSLPAPRDRCRPGVPGGSGGLLSEVPEPTRVRVAVLPNAMRDPAANWWLVLHLAVRCLENGSLRTFWPELERHAAHPRLLIRGIATLVWLGLLLAVPLLAERRHRLIAHTLEATVRSIVRGEQVSAAVDRRVRRLVRRGLSPERARDDLERLLAGFLSGAPKAAIGAAPCHHDHGGGDPGYPQQLSL